MAVPNHHCNGLIFLYNTILYYIILYKELNYSVWDFNDFLYNFLINVLHLMTSELTACFQRYDLISLSYINGQIKNSTFTLKLKVTTA